LSGLSPSRKYQKRGGQRRRRNKLRTRAARAQRPQKGPTTKESVSGKGDIEGKTPANGENKGLEKKDTVGEASKILAQPALFQKGLGGNLIIHLVLLFKKKTV